MIFQFPLPYITDKKHWNKQITCALECNQIISFLLIHFDHDPFAYFVRKIIFHSIRISKTFFLLIFLYVKNKFDMYYYEKKKASIHIFINEIYKWNWINLQSNCYFVWDHFGFTKERIKIMQNNIWNKKWFFFFYKMLLPVSLTYL